MKFFTYSLYIKVRASVICLHERVFKLLGDDTFHWLFLEGNAGELCRLIALRQNFSYVLL